MISLPFGRNGLESTTLNLIESDEKLNVTKIPSIESGLSIESLCRKNRAPIRVFRIYPLRYPKRFTDKLSADRFEEIINWEKLTLYPRYAMSARVGMSSVRGSMMHKDYYAAMSQVSAERKMAEFQGDSGLFERHLEWLGVKYIIAERDSFIENKNFNADKIIIDPKNPDGGNIDFPADFSIWRLRKPKLRNYILYEPNRIIFDINVDGESEMVVLSEQYWSGWRAFDGDKEIPVKSIRKIFRAVELSKGKHRVTMIYDPPLIKIGVLIVVIGILSALIFCIFPSNPSYPILSAFKIPNYPCLKP
jgi:hypothetical protein